MPKLRNIPADQVLKVQKAECGCLFLTPHIRVYECSDCEYVFDIVHSKAYDGGLQPASYEESLNVTCALLDMHRDSIQLRDLRRSLQIILK